MVERQLMGREAGAAVLAGEGIAKENVEPRERRTPRCLNVLLQRDDAGQPHLEAGAVHDAIVMHDDVHAVQKHRLDGFLPGPKR